VVTIEPLKLKPLSENPLVSILSSNYNYGRFVSEAIQSILDQTYPHFELIMCDDGSADDSGTIIERYANRDRRLQLIRKANGGQSSGYNAAYRQCKGELICLLDSDDVYYPHKLARIVENFKAFPQAGFLGHCLIRVDERRRPEGITPLFGRMPSGWQAPNILRKAGILEYLAPGGGLSVRREVAERIFPLPEEAPLKDCGDTPFMLLAPLMTPLIALNEPLAEWRRHGLNRSNRVEITAAYIARELDVHVHQWRLQIEYLTKYHPGTVNSLAPLDTNYHIASLKYTLARLQGVEPVLPAYRLLLQRGRAVRNSQLRPAAFWMPFWIVSILLPRVLFAATYTFLVTPSSVKQALAHVSFRKLSGLAHRGEVSD
jgi:glycosyltransferase involved in cell wall biosynthesis